MASNNTIQSEGEITLGLLKAVQDDEKLTQRSAASDLGIALGLVNTYLKRCVKKGFIKISHVPRNRFAYYLTPQGFAEKSRLTAEYLSQSLSLFRQSQTHYREIFSQCSINGWTTVAFYGAGDLSEIATLCAQEFPTTVTTVIETGAPHETEPGLLAVQALESAGKVDAIIVTDLKNPQQSFDELARILPKDRILTPGFLEIARTPPDLRE